MDVDILQALPLSAEMGGDVDHENILSLDATRHTPLPSTPTDDEDDVARDAIRVVCRFKPLASASPTRSSLQSVDIQSTGARKEDAGQGVCVLQSNKAATASSLQNAMQSGYAPTTDEKQAVTFSFDRIFEPTSTQADVYAGCRGSALVKDVLKGCNATIFAYGQTASGKTHTMMGPDVEEVTLGEHVGVIPRITSDLFTALAELEAASPRVSVEFGVTVSYLEIYMENVRDLLNPQQQNDSLTIHEDMMRNVYVKGLRAVTVSSATDALNLLRRGNRERVTNSTNMNERSSRSHAIFELSVTLREHGIRERKAKLSLVDLAGSEKVYKTGAQGQTLEEAKGINKSLHALGKVINALTMPNALNDIGAASHIPYRDSKLTRILQHSLGGNSRTCLILCAALDREEWSETASTLRFGARAKFIQNKVKINSQFLGGISEDRYKHLLQEANKENDRLKALNTQLSDRLAQKITPPSPGQQRFLFRSSSPALDRQGVSLSDENVPIALRQLLAIGDDLRNRRLDFLQSSVAVTAHHAIREQERAFQQHLQQLHSVYSQHLAAPAKDAEVEAYVTRCAVLTKERDRLQGAFEDLKAHWREEHHALSGEMADATRRAAMAEEALLSGKERMGSVVARIQAKCAQLTASDCIGMDGHSCRAQMTALIKAQQWRRQAHLTKFAVLEREKMEGDRNALETQQELNHALEAEKQAHAETVTRLTAEKEEAVKALQAVVEAQTELAEMQDGDLQRLQRALQTAEENLHSAEENLQSAEEKHKQALVDQQEQFDQLQGDLATQQQSLETELAASQHALQRAETHVATLTEAHATVVKEKEDLETTRAALTGDHDALRAAQEASSKMAKHWQTAHETLLQQQEEAQREQEAARDTLTAAMDALKGDIAAAEATQRAEIEKLQATLNALEKEKREVVDQLEHLTSRFASEKEHLTLSFASEKDQLLSDHAEALGQLRSELCSTNAQDVKDQLNALQQSHAETVRLLREEHAEGLKHLEQAHLDKVTALNEAHSDKLSQMQQAHAERQTMLEKKQEEGLKALQKEQEQQCTRLEQEHQTEINRLTREAAASVEAMAMRQAAEKIAVQQEALKESNMMYASLFVTQAIATAVFQSESSAKESDHVAEKEKLVAQLLSTQTQLAETKWTLGLLQTAQSIVKTPLRQAVANLYTLTLSTEVAEEEDAFVSTVQQEAIRSLPSTPKKGMSLMNLEQSISMPASPAKAVDGRKPKKVDMKQQMDWLLQLEKMSQQRA